MTRTARRYLFDGVLRPFDHDSFEALEQGTGPGLTGLFLSHYSTPGSACFAGEGYAEQVSYLRRVGNVG